MPWWPNRRKVDDHRVSDYRAAIDPYIRLFISSAPSTKGALETKGRAISIYDSIGVIDRISASDHYSRVSNIDIL